MKLRHTITLASALLLAAGCAHEEERHAQYDESISPYAADGTSRYEHQNNTISVNAGGAAENSSVSAGAGTSSNAGAKSESDNTLVTEVRESLQRDPEIAVIAPNITINANNGTIVLSGSVQSDAQKRQIESIAGRAKGVATVKNELQVASENTSGQKGMAEGAPNNTGGQSTDQSLTPTSNGGNNNENRIYSTKSQSTESSGQSLNPTSNSNSAPQIYQDSGSSMSNPNSNALNATSRTNSQSQIYQQNNPGQNTQDQNQNQNQNENTNGNNHMP